MKAGCTSCHVLDDMSACQLVLAFCPRLKLAADWQPALAYQKADGSFTFLVHDEMAIYYHLPGNPQPFPPGFVMRAGDPAMRTYDGSKVSQQAINYSCLRAIGDYSAAPVTPYVPAD
jgi:hypothetical protein